MKTKAELEQARNEANAALWDLERKEKREIGKCLVGKFFKYPRNSYSCPEKESDYWPVYMRILSVDDDGYVSTVEFQKDSRGQITIERRDRGVELSGYVEITEEEFWAAETELQDNINLLLANGK